MVDEYVQEEGWVVCRAFKKKSNGQTKTIEGWDSGYFYNEETISGVDYVSSRQPHHHQSFLGQSFLCKKEIEADNSLTSFIHNTSDQFVDLLPQLESPSLPSIKRPSSSLVSLISHDNNINHNKKNYVEEHQNNKKVTDWRALDKFVASQLSQDDQERHGSSDNHGLVSGFENNEALLLFQQGGNDEGSKFMSPFLNGSSDCDIGICVFDK